MSIPFYVAQKFADELASGELRRYGAILKNAQTGRIVAHLQETGALQKVLQTGLSIDPTGVTNLVGIAQNAAISNKLSAMQSMMGAMQSLQIATLASSVVGVGVTAASTAMILHRLGQIDTALGTIEGKIDALPSQWRDMDLRRKLVTVRTAVDRMQEAEVRPDGDSVMREVEERLSYVFDELHSGIASVVVEAKVDAGLLRTLLAGLAMCGATQVKSLIWLDMKEAAVQRVGRQCDRLQDLAFLMPRDVLAEKLQGGADLAASISRDCSEIRLRTASQADLSRTLIAKGINGRDFIERIQSEEAEPILILPTE